MEFIQSKNLGYKKDHVVYFDTPKMNNAFMTDMSRTFGFITYILRRRRSGQAE